jgi:glutamyl-tRNA synthetase
LEQVRVRFAPSPTGELHVGGARTALFNWLFARRHGGVFVLRIEDTDVARSSEEMTQRILDGMRWLGLDWDEGPFFQSERRAGHVAYALECLKKGAAYYDFSDPEELAGEREALQRAGRPFMYDRRGMEPDVERAGRRIAAGEQAAIRFRVPEGDTVYQDLVHGEVRFQNEKVEDFVLLRGDGTPTYMLSVVADDVAMGITHVIRGDDHIANTPKQILLYDALGKPIPRFAHLPLILGPDKKKLSKRHGGTSLAHYTEQGFLPTAMFNFLTLLGWGPGEDREIFSREELIARFGFDGVGKAAAVFDTAKLEWINSQWINRSGFDDLLPPVRREMEALGIWSDDLLGERRWWFERVVDLLKDRSKRTWDLARDGFYFFRNPESYDEQAIKKFCKSPELPQHLQALIDGLPSLDRWEAPEIESSLRATAERLGIGAGKLIHPLRLGITGLGVTPDVFTIAELLGKEMVSKRLQDFRTYLQSNPEPRLGTE